MAVPLRRCRVCYQQHPKAQLQRWVRQDGEMVKDDRQNAPGRGYYTCSPECEAKLSQLRFKTKTK